MLPVFIEIKKKGKPHYFLYDRSKLNEGIYKGVKIPLGGCIKQGNLIGFMENNNRLQLKKIGKVSNKSPHFDIIPKLKGGNGNYHKKKSLELKSAIHKLRNYYQKNIIHTENK